MKYEFNQIQLGPDTVMTQGNVSHVIKDISFTHIVMVRVTMSASSVGHECLQLCRLYGLTDTE